MPAPSGRLIRDSSTRACHAGMHLGQPTSPEDRLAHLQNSAQSGLIRVFLELSGSPHRYAEVYASCVAFLFSAPFTILAIDQAVYLIQTIIPGFVFPIPLATAADNGHI